jgi:hydrogenase expression/formation protein HypC
MCIGIPGQIVERLPDGSAKVDVCGVRREVNLALVGDATVGQWVLIHVGFAMSVLDETEALDTLEALQNMFAVEPEVGVLLYGEDPC